MPHSTPPSLCSKYECLSTLDAIKEFEPNVHVTSYTVVWGFLVPYVHCIIQSFTLLQNWNDGVLREFTV